MAKLDLTIEKRGTNKFYDLAIDETTGDLETTDGLETAVILSLFAEKRASRSEIAAPELRRGWWGNLLSTVENYEMGSKVWLLEQARLNQETINSSNTFVQQGFEWFIEDSLLDDVIVSSVFTIDNVNINIDLIRAQDRVISRSYELWENTDLYNE